MLLEITVLRGLFRASQHFTYLLDLPTYQNTALTFCLATLLSLLRPEAVDVAGIPCLNPDVCECCSKGEPFSCYMCDSSFPVALLQAVQSLKETLMKRTDFEVCG